MNVAYVDTSAIVAVTFGERGADAVASSLARCSRLISSVLLEAELHAACRREGRAYPVELVAGIDWALADRPLSSEIKAMPRVDGGYVQSACPAGPVRSVAETLT